MMGSSSDASEVSLKAQPERKSFTDDCAATYEALRAESALDRRIEICSSRFLGRPYVDSPLGGGPLEREVLTTDTSGFDCVTYVETVLALSISNSQLSFKRRLRSIRYNNGQVDWFKRNHYMIDWAKRNETAGFVRNCTAGEFVVKRRRVLNLIPSLPSKEVALRCLPKQRIARDRAIGKSGDILLFVSTRRNLDVFHLGFLIRRESERLLRHASRTARCVIEEDLNSFLSRYRMAGVILLRPTCPA